MLQLILCLFSILGYYLIKKKPMYAYLTFMLQNIIAFMFIHQWYMFINLISCFFFFIVLIKREEKEKTKEKKDDDNYSTYLKEEFPCRCQNN